MFCCSFVAKRFGQDCVAVIVVEDHDVAVSGHRVVGKSASLIGINLASPGGDVNGAGEDLIGSVFIAEGWCRREVVVMIR